MKLHPDFVDFIAALNTAKVDVFFLGREAYIKNKKSTGRNKDLADLELLETKIFIPRRTKKTKSF